MCVHVLLSLCVCVCLRVRVKEPTATPSLPPPPAPTVLGMFALPDAAVRGGPLVVVLGGRQWADAGP